MVTENNKSLINLDELPSDILQQVPDDQIGNVLEVLKKDWPESLSVYNFIETHARWKRNDPEEQFYLLCPHGSWQDGTIIGIAPKYIPMMLVYTLENSCVKLRKALQETRVINWGHSYYRFPALHNKHLDAVIQTIQSKGFTKEFIYLPNNAYWVPKEKAIKIHLECPDDMYVAPLQITHAPLVNQEWPHHIETSLPFIERLIKYNLCLGLFTKDESKLISWVLNANYGLGMLNTIEGYRRKGYASVVLNHVFKKIAEAGDDVSIHAIITNGPSNALLRSIGCEQTCYVTWVNCIDKTVNGKL